MLPRRHARRSRVCSRQARSHADNKTKELEEAYAEHKRLKSVLSERAEALTTLEADGARAASEMGRREEHYRWALARIDEARRETRVVARPRQ